MVQPDVAQSPAELLARHVVLHTRDPEEFRAYIARTEEPTVRRLEDPEGFEVELRHAALGRIDVALCLSKGPLHAEATRGPNAAYLVQFPLEGQLLLELDGRSYTVAPGQGVVISPPGETRRMAEPGATIVLRIDPILLRTRLGGSAAARPRELRFEPLLASAAGELRSYVLVMAEAAERGRAKRGSAVARALEVGFVDLLLELQPHTPSQRSSNHAAEPAQRVEAVERYVLAHMGEALSIRALARAGGCSPRSLQLTFAEACGMSPSEFVRRRRLGRARDLLLSGEPELSVLSVALRVGLPHLGRFAASYKALYGERPSETLRRSASARGEPDAR